MLTSKGTLSAVLAASVGSAAAFNSQSLSSSSSSSRSLSLLQLGATVDPTVVTKKEYQDICGVEFDDSTLANRLAKTAYLYPKHVEVIDDFAPLVDKMVDEIVSQQHIMCIIICMQARTAYEYRHGRLYGMMHVIVCNLLFA